MPYLPPSVRVPMLVVAGEKDLFTPLARSRELAAALVEQPDLINLAVEKLLRLHGLAEAT